jgi:plasmid stabilization system protein ParE
LVQDKGGAHAAFILHPAAEAELREIVRYTRKQWGAEQARDYAIKLRQCIQALADGKIPYKDMSRLHPGLRIARCERHYVFCLLRQDPPALVVAILHERMDIVARLEHRLK